MVEAWLIQDGWLRCWSSLLYCPRQLAVGEDSCLFLPCWPFLHDSVLTSQVMLTLLKAHTHTSSPRAIDYWPLKSAAWLWLCKDRTDWLTRAIKRKKHVLFQYYPTGFSCWNISEASSYECLYLKRHYGLNTSLSFPPCFPSLHEPAIFLEYFRL